MLITYNASKLTIRVTLQPNGRLLGCNPEAEIDVDEGRSGAE